MSDFLAFIFAMSLLIGVGVLIYKSFLMEKKEESENDLILCQVIEQKAIATNGGKDTTYKTHIRSVSNPRLEIILDDHLPRRDGSQLYVKRSKFIRH